MPSKEHLKERMAYNSERLEFAESRLKMQATFFATKYAPPQRNENGRYPKLREGKLIMAGQDSRYGYEVKLPLTCRRADIILDDDEYRWLQVLINRINFFDTENRLIADILGKSYEPVEIYDYVPIKKQQTNEL